MQLLSIPFLLETARDEVAERFGAYFNDPLAHRCHFLDHRAVGLAADGNGGVPYVMWGRARNWRANNYLRSKGNVLWVRTDELGLFVEQVLPRMDRKFVLVTSEADYSPLHYDRRSAEAVLGSEKIAHWFCAQSDISRGTAKHTPMPLGLPYPYRNDIYWAKSWFPLDAHQIMSYRPQVFDRRLKAMIASRRPLAERKLLAVADFALNNTSAKAPWGETRAQIGEQLRGNPHVAFMARRVPQFSLYQTYLEHAFVISPFGRGLDCYRTWEAMLMGAIPIVKRSALDPVFDGFPAVIVDDWREITGENLARWAGRFQGAWADGAVEQRLTLSYWVDRIRQNAATSG